MTVKLNDDTALVEKIKAGLLKTGGYCPCSLNRTPDYLCICEDFKQKIQDPNFFGPCKCGLYVKLR